jgi:hypothetical protein
MSSLLRMARFGLAVLALTAAPVAGRDDPTGDWVALFNGKNLDGWTVKIAGHEAGDNYGNTFRVEDGILKVRYDSDKYPEFRGRFGHIFTKEKFSRYRLRVEYRFVGDQVKGAPAWALRNSGIMFHSESAKSMRKDQEFPVSIEAQFLGGTGQGERPTLSVCTPGTNIVMGGQLITRHCTNSKSKTFHGDQWVRAEIEVHGGGRVVHRVNGEVVIEYEKPQLDPADPDGKRLIKDGKLLLETGHIALQSESHPVEFRKIEIKVLQE